MWYGSLSIWDTTRQNDVRTTIVFTALRGYSPAARLYIFLTAMCGRVSMECLLISYLDVMPIQRSHMGTLPTVVAIGNETAYQT